MMNRNSVRSEDFSSSSDSDSSSFDQPPTHRNRQSGFASIMEDWMGDDPSLMDASAEEPAQPLIRQKKKKLVPRTSSALSSASTQSISETNSTQRCYLVKGSQTQGSLIEHYSEEPVDDFLAYWTAPPDKKIPKFKFTQNWGKSELINSTQGDLRGKRAYFSGICQWLRKAKTFGGTIKFCNHVPQWECDLYFYLLEPVDGVQTLFVRDGQVFPISKADGVAIVPRGSDFLHYDPRFQCGIEKWVSEGSKLGFASKLDVRAGSAYPENTISKSFGGARGKPQSREEDKEDYDEEPKSRMVEGAPVYVRDPHYSWIPALIESAEDDKKRVKIKVCLPKDWEEHTVLASGRGAKNMKLERLVKLTDYGNDELPLQNLEKDGVTAMGKNDMADLTNLHEAAILYNLKARHATSLPYTRVGDILVAVNPFQWIKGLYSEEKQDFYAKNLIWQADGNDLMSPRSSMRKLQLATAASEKKAIGYDYEKLGINPHVYETSSLAYLGLAVEGTDQTILVTGESGAGKTETIKIVMNALALVERTRPSWPESDRVASSEHGSDTVNRVLQANPLFEAFGNAKTTRNDNSSRFGKFTQLQFDAESVADAHSGGRTVPSCHLAGSKCITYLLEKSRIVSVSEGERTFHIFYQLLGAPDEAKRDIWEGLVGTTTSDFQYLSKTTPDSIDGLASPENWPDTVAALSVFGIKGDKFLNVMRSLCVILQLGNITFDPEMHDGEERSVISSAEELRKLSALMGVSEPDIESALTKRIMTTRGEDFTIFLKPNEARDGCDALAKEIYARVFDLLVTNCNEATEPKGSPSNEYGTISLLDIFGFESFKVNRFEQLCINYANERLQLKYVVDNFQAIKHEYEGEGINVFDFSLVDNTEVVELLEGKLGLITQLNEECVKKGVCSTDENFVYKFKVVNSDSSRMIQDHLHRPYEFGIRHYAAPIKYDARKFLERNLDKIPTDLMKCACQSSNPLIRAEFQRLSTALEAPKSSGPKKRSEATKHLVVTKFKHQLTSLMGLIEKSRTRYIRCVKPNKEMKPKMMDHSHTHSQLESAGLVTAIVISRESFPNRLSYELVMKRFRFLTYMLPDCNLDSGDIKVDSETLLNHLLAGVTADSHQGKVKPFACGKTRVYFRAGALETIETIRQEHYQKGAVKLQAWTRALLQRRYFLSMKRGMICLQSDIRRYLARASFVRTVQIIVTLQCFVRQCLAGKELSRRRKTHASTVIQTRWRGMKPRGEFKTIRKSTVSIQSFYRMIMAKKVAAAKKKELNEQNAIETRMSMIQQTFDDATTVQGTVFSVDEGLLDEVETMFEFLRKEIVVLRKKNTKLKKELAEAESDKREIFNHASSVDHAYALSKIRNEQMTKTNVALLDDNNKRRKEVSKLKNELKTQQQAHESQLQEMRAEFEMALRHREMEVSAMQDNLRSSAALHRREMQMVRDEAVRKQEEHYSQISRLRDEIKNTQDSHQDYLSKLMDVLETTQESRQTISAPSANMIMSKKDEEIAELRDEVARLRQSVGGEGNGETDSSKKEAIKSMKYIVKKNREQRKSRVQQITALAGRLEQSVASGDLAQVQHLLASMKEAIQIGEKSNSKMDREIVNMIDNTATYAPGGAAGADAALLAENQKLRKKLEKPCKKCGRKQRKGDKSVGETASVLEGVSKV